MIVPLLATGPDETPALFLLLHNFDDAGGYDLAAGNQIRYFEVLFPLSVAAGDEVDVG